jgi:hypothetical protein
MNATTKQEVIDILRKNYYKIAEQLDPSLSTCEGDPAPRFMSQAEWVVDTIEQILNKEIKNVR